MKGNESTQGAPNGFPDISRVEYKKNLNLILVEVVGKYLLFNLLVNTREEQTKCKSCAIGKTFKVRNNVPKVFVGRFLWL